MSVYPSGLPSPLVEDYSVDTRYGVSAVMFERGNTRQRRSASKQRQVFQLTMLLTTTSQLWEWQSWANAYGYDWHLMDLVSNHSGAAGGVPLAHYVRYIGDPSIQLVGANNFRVTVPAEMDIDRLPVGVIVIPSGDVFIGGTPASPSNSNSIQAGTPASPSTNSIIAGSPGLTA